MYSICTTPVHSPVDMYSPISAWPWPNLSYFIKGNIDFLGTYEIRRKGLIKRLKGHPPLGNGYKLLKFLSEMTDKYN